MGNNCGACSSNGSIEYNIYEFFEEMSIKKMTHQEFLSKIKSNFAEKSRNKIPDTIAFDTNGALKDNQKAYFSELLKNYDFSYFVLCLMFFCVKDLSSFKKNFEYMTKSLKLGENIVKSKDNKYIFINKDFLIKIVSSLCEFYSLNAIKPISESSNLESTLVNEMERRYSKQKCEKYATNLVENNSYDPNNKKPNEEIDFSNFVDFDYFFQQKYVELSDDVKVREEVFNLK